MLLEAQRGARGGGCHVMWEVKHLPEVTPLLKYTPPHELLGLLPQKKKNPESLRHSLRVASPLKHLSLLWELPLLQRQQQEDLHFPFGRWQLQQGCCCCPCSRCVPHFC